MISLAICSLVFIACALLGAGIREMYLRRSRMTEELYGFSLYVAGEVRLGHTMPNIVSGYTHRNSAYVNELFEDIELMVRNGAETSDGCRTSLFRERGAEDWLRLLLSLCRDSGLGIDQKCEVLINKARHLAEKALHEYNDKGKLYYKLGVLLGVALMIILA